MIWWTLNFSDPKLSQLSMVGVLCGEASNGSGLLCEKHAANGGVDCTGSQHWITEWGQPSFTSTRRQQHCWVQPKP